LDVYTSNAKAPTALAMMLKPTITKLNIFFHLFFSYNR
jgi:hypothetical protein